VIGVMFSNNSGGSRQTRRPTGRGIADTGRRSCRSSQNYVSQIEQIRQENRIEMRPALKR